jgi:hypothetical protein
VPERVTDTRFKLEEAAYFLEQMKSNFKNPRAFVYNLDTFLSSARSVTLVMQYEFEGKDKKFGNWYNSRMKQMSTEIDLYNKLRVKVVHLEGSTRRELMPKVGNTLILRFSNDGNLSIIPVKEKPEYLHK